MKSIVETLSENRLSYDNLSNHSALTLLSNLPVISFENAVRKVRNGKYHTIGKRNSDNYLEIFLCAASGKPLAIVDVEGR